MRLSSLIGLYHSSRHNAVLALLGVLLLGPLHLAYALEAWRRRVRPHMDAWLAAAGEFEALLSLAGYAYEHPGDLFPEIVDGGPLFDGLGLGHPLIPAARCVRNDVRLDSEQRLLIISGSNMSGKTTMLRTVGVNAVLALAGAPVRATRLRLSVLAVGASVHVPSSLREGTSHFYAEMARLKAIADRLGGPAPVLFLLDELMHGTNSADRRIGSQAILRAFLSGGAIGMVTTHDLALADMVGEFGDSARNAHFEYQLADGAMVFDYRMHPGVVKGSNALQVMRSLGLDV
jgi:DNA mismatch repair ATPase MutS